MDVKKTKVESLDIIVTMMEDKPYYGIKYKEVGSDHFCIGYSSYRLERAYCRKEGSLVPSREVCVDCKAHWLEQEVDE